MSNEEPQRRQGYDIYDDIIILYGSQRGRVAKAAKRFHEMLSERLIERFGSEVTPAIPFMTLDDFIKNDNVPWKRIVLIFVSSFGNGGPPSGSIKFRKICQHWVEHQDNGTATTNNNNNNNNDTSKLLLHGIKFSMCGFGDTYYKTYMKNPTIIMNGLQIMGATLIGAQGKIDCNMDYEEDKIEEQFIEWITNFWDPFDHITDTIIEQYKNNHDAMIVTNEHLVSMKTATRRIINNL